MECLSPPPRPVLAEMCPVGSRGRDMQGGWWRAPPPASRAQDLGSPRSPIASAPVWSGRPAGAERLQCPWSSQHKFPVLAVHVLLCCLRDRQHPSVVAESAHWALRTVQVGCGVTGSAGSGWTWALSQVQALCSGAQTERAAVTRCVLTADPREPTNHMTPDSLCLHHDLLLPGDQSKAHRLSQRPMSVGWGFFSVSTGVMRGGGPGGCHRQARGI